jgi:hypothetical protein
MEEFYMKKRVVFWSILVLLLVFGLAFTSCDTDSKATKFEGRWYNTNGVVRYAFSGNNFTLYDPDATVNGTFTFDDFNIRFTASNGATNRTTYSLSGNTLRIDSGGSSTGSIAPAGWWTGTWTRR